jgi:phenylalanyl-tRNA synthetase beta chain
MLRPARVRQVLGIEIPVDRIRVLLEALEFSCTPEEPGLKVRVPSHRQDVLEEADLIEEVARHYGYDNLPVTVPHGEPQGAMPAEDELEEWVRDSLARLGWSELLTPSLHHPELLERYRLEAQPATVMNPLSEDQRVLRPALFPSLVEVVRRNLRVRNRDLCFFEISRVFHPQGQEVLEPLRLGLALCRPGMGFLDLKGALEQLALMAGLDFVFESSPQAWLHPGRAARIRVGEQILGWAGEIHPHLAGELDLETSVALAELDLDLLSGLRSPARYRPISRFPEVERDLALLVAEEVPAGTLAGRMAQAGGDLVRALVCFDVYHGAQVPEGHKSLAFRVLLQAPDRTLTEDEIQRVLRRILKMTEREFSARLRD